MEIITQISIQEVAKKQIETTKQVYLLSPARMFSEFNGEKENVKNYNGRQLLEMLQNADDAASEAKGEKKVLIKLEKNQLIIANTGYPFSEEGLTSIFHSHLSPKEAQENQIGKKGLGFRSILSWTNKVTIKSHELCVSFSKDYSKTVLEELLENSEFAISFNKLKKKSKDFPISTLVCPDVTSIDSHSFLKYSDYDTIILIDLKDESLKDVNQQIDKDLDGEVLLFLNYLESIELNLNGVITKYIKEVAPESKVKLKTINYSINSDPIEKLWNINTIQGHFEEFDRSYQLSLAWKDELDEEKDVIYSFFRTKVPFHFKGILHGTFELNADRNDIISEDDYNKELVGLIPGLIADTSEMVANNETKMNYKALCFTQFDNTILPAIMQEADFVNKFNNALKIKKILPTISNKYISIIDEPVYYKQNIFAKLLSQDEFPDILIDCEDENTKTYLDTFDTKTYTFKSICNAVSAKAKQYSINEYATLISVLIDFVDLETEEDKYNLCLFFDLDFNPLTFNNSIFFPSNEAYEKLPTEVGVQVIHPKLAEELKMIFEVSSYELLSEKLSKYQIKTFDFNEIIGLFISHYYSDKSKIEDIKELNQHIYKLYKSENPQIANWQGESVPLISKSKKIAEANQLYIGKEYGCTITEAIYSYDKNKLVSPPKEFGIEVGDIENWKSYIKWLGVSELPRKIQQKETKEFAEYVFKKFDYKNKIGWDRQFNNFVQFRNSLSYYGQVIIQSIDDFENIITKNKTETIIAWLCSDNDIYKLIESDTEPSGSKVGANFGNGSYDREIFGKHIRNYIRWKLLNSKWINTKSGFIQSLDNPDQADPRPPVRN